MASMTLQPTGASSTALNSSVRSLSESDPDWLHPTTLPGALLSQLSYLQHLDCSSMDRLTSIQGLPCTLLSLNLGNCRNLQDLGPLVHCTKLISLTLSGNYHHWRAMVESLPPVTEALGTSLIQLEISTHVPCREPQTWDTAADEALLRCLAPLKGLQGLRLTLARGCVVDWREMGPILGTMTDLTLLDLSVNYLGTHVMALTPGLSKLTGLRHLNLSYNCLTGNATVAAVAQAIAPLTCITWLYLSANAIRAAAATLAPALQAIGPNLTLLDISGNHLRNGGFADLAPSLKCMTALTSLDCSVNDLTSTSVHLLTTVILPHTTNLRRLALAGDPLGPSGVRELLPAMQALEGLDMFRTELGAEGVEVLAAGLGTLTALRRLRLCKPDLDTAPIQAAAAALPDLTLTVEMI